MILDQKYLLKQSFQKHFLIFWIGYSKRDFEDSKKPSGTSNLKLLKIRL